jgi:hypothetical protein
MPYTPPPIWSLNPSLTPAQKKAKHDAHKNAKQRVSDETIWQLDRDGVPHEFGAPSAPDPYVMELAAEDEKERLVQVALHTASLGELLALANDEAERDRLTKAWAERRTQPLSHIAQPEPHRELPLWATRQAVAAEPEPEQPAKWDPMTGDPPSWANRQAFGAKIDPEQRGPAAAATARVRESQARSQRGQIEARLALLYAQPVRFLRGPERRAREAEIESLQTQLFQGQLNEMDITLGDLAAMENSDDQQPQE